MAKMATKIFSSNQRLEQWSCEVEIMGPCTEGRELPVLSSVSPVVNTRQAAELMYGDSDPCLTDSEKIFHDSMIGFHTESASGQ